MSNPPLHDKHLNVHCIGMPVASLPDLELVCAPRSSLSTQKYKPKVGGQITLLSPLAQILGGRVPLSPRDLRHWSPLAIRASYYMQPCTGLFIYDLLLCDHLTVQCFK